MKRKILTLICLLTANGLLLLAQNTAGTGSITGIVQDATGAVVPGAKVVIENQSKGIHRELTTNDGGVFSAPSLVPAPGYSVSVTKEGFVTSRTDNIELSVGQTIQLTPILAVGGTSARVEVTSEAPIVDSTQSAVSQVIDSRQLMDLPINGRRVDSFVLLTPGVTPDAAFGLLSFRGLAGGNSFLTDGVDTTNQYYNENAGRTRTYNISQDAVQEFQVVTSNFLAQYGNASGGVVNTITRSGTNNLHGTAYWFFRNRTLNATDITANGQNPQDWRHQAGASIGGPLKKDKLFYFFNGELQRRDFPIISSNSGNTSLFNPAGGGYVPYTTNGTPNCVVGPNGATATQCANAIAYLTSRAQTQLVPRTSDVNLAFGKVDYQINDNNRLSAELNYLDFRSPNGIQTQSSLASGNGIGNNANTNVFDRTGKLGLVSTLSPNAVNEARFGYFKDRQYDPASPSLLPSIGPVALTVQNISNLGYATSYPRLNPSEQRFQFSDTLSYTVGKHNLKFGAEYSHLEDYVNQLSNRFGTYTYTSFTSFAEDFSGNTTGAKHWSSFSQAFGNPVVDVNLNEIAGFIQDEWHVTPKLTISPGIRYDKALLPTPPANPAIPQTGFLPDTSLNFGPRFGISYAFNDKTVFRGGYGIFYDKYVTSTIASLFTENGAYQKSYSLVATGSNGAAQLAAGPVFPSSLAAVPNVNGSATLAFADHGYRNPYSEQANIAIERQLTKDSSLTVSGIWSRGLHIASARDANAGAPTSSYTYPILNTQNQITGYYTTPLYTRRINPAYGTIYELDSGLNSYYSGLTVQYQKRFSGWFQGQAAYTYSHAIDYNIGGAGNTLYVPFINSVFNGAYSQEKGSASTDERHRLVVNGIVTPKFTQSTSRFARYFVNNWELSAISNFGSAFPEVPEVFVGSGHPGGLLSTSTINGLGGSRRVPFESTSALNIDQLYRTDARITKILPFSERFRTKLMFEAVNVFNHPYINGAYPARQPYQYQTVSYNRGYALAPYPNYGAPLETQGPPDGTTARRAQAAIRFEW
jgi:Carboxypeptidase regulatory-like domain/TonB-dependent Receptor Plug Domain